MEQIKVLLNSLPHYKKVIFALYCCNDVKHLMNPEGHKCLELLEKWIEDNYSVSMEELRDASTCMYAAIAHSAAFAYSLHAAYSTANTAAAHTAAVHAAAYAAAHNAKGKAKINENKVAQYKKYLLRMIDELTPLEKEFI